MDNFRPWAMWRRIFYGTGFMSFWALVGVVIYFTNFYELANCFDQALNNGEVEVDAGGPCVRIPAGSVIQPVVAWAESFEVTPGQYNAVAYIDNRNLGAGVPSLPYTFTFYNEGQVIAEKNGVTALPANSSYPVFEGRIFTDGQLITDTRLTLGDPSMWVPVVDAGEQFKTNDLNLLDDDIRPRLEAQLENTSLTSVRNIEVIATIFNDLGRAVASSQTYVESFPSRTVQDVVFTWPQSIARTVRSCSIPTDVLVGIDLSGSMNNDQDEPPQPVTDALAAAGEFMDNLGVFDQVGVVTFATDAQLVQPLALTSTVATDIITNLTIDPSEENGVTNTAAALATATTELTSDRHNTEARRALVLLTDGLPTAGGTEAAIAAAQAAAAQLSASGIDVYVIGLGANVDQEFVRSIASSPSNAYIAPSRSDLAAIYAAITASLCEVGPTKIEVITKPPVNFAPLR